MDNNENVVQPESTPVQPEKQTPVEAPQNVEEKVPSPEEAQQELKDIIASFGFDRAKAEDEMLDNVDEEIKSNGL